MLRYALLIEERELKRTWLGDAGRVLDLPARSRFSEGRVETFH